MNGSRPQTGGRQKGACNRATAEARAAAEATGILPLDYMLLVMRDAGTEPKRRDAWRWRPLHTCIQE